MDKYPEFAAWGRLGGIKRARKLSAKRRKDIAKKAVEARERKRRAAKI